VAKRILLVDDHQLVREALRRALQDAGYVVLEADDGERAVERALTAAPHVILMDVSMPGLDGMAATRALRTRVPDARVLILTMHDEDRLVLEAREAGAAGYLLKTAASSEVVAAVAQVLAGHTVFPELSGAAGPIGGAVDGGGGGGGGEGAVDDHALSSRERQILQLLADGRTPDEVAEMLVISPKTVRNHLTRTYDKLGVDSRTRAIVVALRCGYIDLS
jgi:two-component system, NarL family, response regulator NreC